MNILNLLDAREYKLLLKPALFGGGPDPAMANRFLQEIRSNLAAENQPVTVRKSFDAPERRRIRYFDLKPHVLDPAGYSLRLRTVISPKPDGPPRPALTLKLRTPDLFIAADRTAAVQQAAKEAKEAKEAGAAREEDKQDLKTKLEEDISPLEVSVSADTAAPVVAVSARRSMRSRWALSATRAWRHETVDEDLGAVLDGFGRMVPKTTRTRISGIPISGPEIEEFVFEGPKLVFDRDQHADLCLTLWYRADLTRVFIAEMSYRIEVKDGQVAGTVARRALDFFTSMQMARQGWADTAQVSKTELALP